MNDTGYFEYNEPGAEEFADKRVQDSYDWYKKMEARYKALPSTKIVLMGSTPYDETAVIGDSKPFTNKNKAMVRIVDFQRKSAEENGWEFIDLNAPMTQLNEKFQQNDPTFTLCGNDRIHPDNDGHMVMAYLFLKAQGFAGKEVAAMEIDGSKTTTLSSVNCTISDLKKTSDGLSFGYLAQSLPYPLDTIARGWGNKKSQAEADRVVPFVDEMNREMLQVTGLKGKYRLYIDEEEIGVWSGNEYAKGINLALQTNTPQYQQALKVMFLNEDRWEIERRFREYMWMQYMFFREKGLLFADNSEAIRVLDENKHKNGWVQAKRDIYTRAMHPEIRKAWENEMDLLVSTIYELNTPVKRKITLVRVK